ncbi:MAG TPA: hypothetical protein VGK88_08400 [bacterium]|jgi:hypothetical protein
MISESEATKKLGQAIGRVDARLVLDRPSVRYMADPFAGVEYGLRLGSAGALLFMPEADLVAPDWESRLFKRLESAKRYLETFPQERPARR